MTGTGGAGKNPMTLSVLIPAYNSRDLLHRCLLSLEASKGDFDIETIVVDNASTDGTADMVEEEHPSVKLIRNDVDRCFAPATNQAFLASSGEKVLLLNSDIELPPDALAKMVQASEEQGYVAVVPLLRGLDGQPQRQYIFRKLPSVTDIVLNLLFFRRIARALRLRTGWDSSDASIDVDSDVEQPAAACMLIDRQIYSDLDGLDESLPLWFNDVDLCKRLALANHRIRFLHGISVTHVGEATTSQLDVAYRAERLHQDTANFVLKWHPRAILLCRLAILVSYGIRSLLVLRYPRQVPDWIRSTPKILAPLRPIRS